MQKTAIIHDWFTTYAGSERVIEQLLQIFPDADLFGLIDILSEEEKWFIQNKAIHTSFIQNAPYIRNHYRSYLPLMPLAIEQFDLSIYNLIISNCHAVSKGVICNPEQLHISYIHSPIRYAWDLQETYLGSGGMKNAIARLFLHYIRMWDITAAQRPDKLIASSRFIAKRIQKFYRRPSTVIYPPADTDYFTPGGEKEDFYLTVSRLVPYKRIDLILKAFQSMPDKKLVVMGEGPEARKLENITAPNITWLGFQPAHVLREYLRRCRAFVFASKEDFGIIPIEAQACGTPVIAFGEGGALETVNGLESQQPTGIFFQPQTQEALQMAILEFESNAAVFTPEVCRRNAERFSNQRFQKEFQEFISSACDEFFENCT